MLIATWDTADRTSLPRFRGFRTNTKYALYIQAISITHVARRWKVASSKGWFWNIWAPRNLSRPFFARKTKCDKRQMRQVGERAALPSSLTKCQVSLQIKPIVSPEKQRMGRGGGEFPSHLSTPAHGQNGFPIQIERNQGQQLPWTRAQDNFLCRRNFGMWSVLLLDIALARFLLLLELNKLCRLLCKDRVPSASKKNGKNKTLG